MKQNIKNTKTKQTKKTNNNLNNNNKHTTKIKKKDTQTIRNINIKRRTQRRRIRITNDN